MLALLTLLGCSGETTANKDDLPDGTFATIQHDIFNVSCVSCHSAGSSDARNSGLVLTADVSYDQLVGAQSTQTVAHADGLLRVKSGKPDSSLLFHKLDWIPGHHSRDYGVLMPMGRTTGITTGQLEYIRRWIAAGAPKAGHVVEASVLSDSRVQVATFTPLSAPAAGTGIQLTVDSFGVAAVAERELFVYRTLSNTQDMYVTRIETRMRPGSHHLLLYTFDPAKTAFPCNSRPSPNVVRDIRNADGTMNLVNMLPMACHVFFGGSMTPEGDYRFPPGFALKLPAGSALDFNVHYVNRSGGTLAGQAYANLYTADPSTVQPVRTLNLANQSFSLPPRQRTTVRTEFPVSSTTRVFALTSHMHSLGEKYEIRVKRRTGEEVTVYVNTDWEHPAFTNFSTPLVLEAGDALVSVVTWNNVTDRTISFGLASTDEMDIIFGYAY